MILLSLRRLTMTLSLDFMTWYCSMESMGLLLVAGRHIEEVSLVFGTFPLVSLSVVWIFGGRLVSLAASGWRNCWFVWLRLLPLWALFCGDNSLSDLYIFCQCTSLLVLEFHSSCWGWLGIRLGVGVLPTGRSMTSNCWFVIRRLV